MKDLFSESPGLVEVDSQELEIMVIVGWLLF
jgi:hypothetical protein